MTRIIQDVLRLGTRGSELARWQTNHIIMLLSKAYQSLPTETIVISTKGDQVLDTPLPLVGGKGLFTAELEAALHSGQIDFAVHSLKDLPTEDPPGLVVGAIPERANPADVLVSRHDHTLNMLPKGSVIGTSSRRRAAQLLRQRPDLEIRDIRGNVNTRIRKSLAADGPYDAIVLAYAGLVRLNKEDVITQVLSFEQMLPAPGQAALGVQCREETESLDILKPIRHETTALAVIAERAFLAGLGGGCSVPVAAYAVPDGAGIFTLRGRVSAVDGSRQIDILTTFAASGGIKAARQAGTMLAQEARKQGAESILEEAQ
jgi:hydroxymethylbilane synthase